MATVKAQDIENKPFTSIDKALQGQVAGLQSVAASGARVPTRLSVSAESVRSQPAITPLGYRPCSRPSNDVSPDTTANIPSTLNPNDIESVIAERRSLRFIYGSRAANGVIPRNHEERACRQNENHRQRRGSIDIAYKNDKYRLNALEYITPYYGRPGQLRRFAGDNHQYHELRGLPQRRIMTGWAPTERFATAIQYECQWW